MRLMMLFFALLLGLGCESKPPAEPTTTPPTPAPAPTTASQTTGEPAAPDEPDFAKFADRDWCPKAHADTVKIVEAMKQTMKRAGTRTTGDDYTPPPAARYVELCGKLPLGMQKCLVVGYAARNREECQQTLEGLDPEARTTYGELMGK